MIMLGINPALVVDGSITCPESVLQYSIGNIYMKIVLNVQLGESR
jgi:hypothetical protein